MNNQRVDQLIQYALAVAGQLPWNQRQLGPIHLVKYAYLGDLAYASSHGGETYTGSSWQFFHFGPWSGAVQERVEPALNAVSAQSALHQSEQYGEYVRYSLQSEALLTKLELSLPLEVAKEIKHAVHAFGADTERLLHRVYTTAPMLRAAPKESLDFAPEPEDESAHPKHPREPKKLSRKAAAKRKQALQALKNELKQRLSIRLRDKGRPVSPQPRYDETFFRGVKQLDALAGEPINPGSVEVEFSDTIWKSPGRRQPDVP